MNPLGSLSIDELLKQFQQAKAPQPPAAGPDGWPAGLAYGPEGEARLRQQQQAAQPAAAGAPTGNPPPAQTTIPGGLQQPTLPPMPQLGPAPTMPQFNPVSGDDSRFQQLMAEGGYQGGRAGWMANPVGALGSDQAKAVGAQASAQASAPYLQAAGQQEDPSRINLGSLQAMINASGEQAKAQGAHDAAVSGNYQAMLGGQAQLGAANLHAQGQLGAAQIDAAAKNGPHAAFNQAIGGLAAGMATGQVNPEGVKATLDLLSSLKGSHPGAPQTAPQPGQPAPQTPEAVLGALAKSNQLSQAAGGAFAGPDGKPLPALGIGQGDKFLDALMVARVKADSPELSDLANKIKAGKLGDPGQVLRAITQSAARAQYQMDPPRGPDNQILDFMSATPDQIPVTRDVTDAGKLLYQFQAGKGIGGRALGVVGGGKGIPYNKVQLPNGVVVPIDPSDLGQGWTRGSNKTPASVLQGRAGYGNALIKALAGAQ